MAGKSKFHTRNPAIKKDIASINNAQPDPYNVTSVPPKSAPRTKPILLDRATIAFPSFKLVLGKISGSTPVIAGHQSALSTPKIAPIKANNQTEGK